MKMLDKITKQVPHVGNAVSSGKYMEQIMQKNKVQKIQCI